MRAARHIRGGRWADIAPLVAAVVLLALHNVVGNEVAPDVLYVPLNLTTAVILLGLARKDGCSWDSLGLDPSAWRSGAWWGGKLAALTGVGITLGAAWPRTRDLFRDERVAGLSLGVVAYQALVRIPVGTVALEEVAFRGVLLAMLGKRVGTVRAVAGSSAMFGLWHILPTMSALQTNDLAGGLAATSLAVGAAVVGTALGGAFLCWLRLRSGSLLAPALLHWAANGFSILAATAVLRAG